jgi:hypothetical protein
MTYILDYINYNFKVTMSGMLSVSVFDKQLNREISVTQMSEGIQKVFDLTDNEFNDIFKNWVNVQSVILQNKVVDYQTEIYNKTGVKLEITPEIFRAFDKDKIDIIKYILNKPDDIKGLLEYIRENNTIEYDKLSSY